MKFDLGTRISLMIRARRKKMGKLHDCIVEWIQGDLLYINPRIVYNSSEFYLKLMETELIYHD